MTKQNKGGVEKMKRVITTLSIYLAYGLLIVVFMSLFWFIVRILALPNCLVWTTHHIGCVLDDIEIIGLYMYAFIFGTLGAVLSEAILEKLKQNFGVK